MNIAIQLSIIIVLTLVNAFFASAEMAIVSVNKTKIRMLAESGDKKAILLDKIVKEPSNFLSTIQVGITLAGFFSSASAARGISKILGEFLEKFDIPYGDTVSFVLVTIILSYITLVFGELYPKRLALKNSEKIAMFSITPIALISKLTKPFVKLLSMSTNLLLRITGINDDDLEEKMSREEIRSLVDVGEEHGVINETERKMIDSIFEFDDTLAKEVMTPRTEVFMIDIDKSSEENLKEIMEMQFTRTPVYKDNPDNIIGIVNIKDMTKEAYTFGFDNLNFEKIMRPAYFVPERKAIDDLFNELQNSKQHMAILIDEYGGFSGIATIEDLIEEVMGEIDDEFDINSSLIKKIDDYTYEVDGLISIEDLNDTLFLELDEDSEDYDTLGGFLVNEIGFIPEEDHKSTTIYNGIEFNIEKVKDKRIESVIINTKNMEEIKNFNEERTEEE